jgi:hypothetical protein
MVCTYVLIGVRVGVETGSEVKSMRKMMMMKILKVMVMAIKTAQYLVIPSMKSPPSPDTSSQQQRTQQLTRPDVQH